MFVQLWNEHYALWGVYMHTRPATIHILIDPFDTMVSVRYALWTEQYAIICIYFIYFWRCTVLKAQLICARQCHLEAALLSTDPCCCLAVCVCVCVCVCWQCHAEVPRSVGNRSVTVVFQYAAEISSLFELQKWFWKCSLSGATVLSDQLNGWTTEKSLDSETAKQQQSY